MVPLLLYYQLCICSMFCTLICLLNQVCFFSFFLFTFFGKIICQLSHLDAAPQQLTCLYVISVMMMFSATDEGDVTDCSCESVSVLVLTGLNCYCFSMGSQLKKKSYNKRKSINCILGMSQPLPLLPLL